MSELEKYIGEKEFNEATVNGIIQQILKNNKFIISKDDELKIES